MNAARFVVRNMGQFRRELETADKNRVKAGQSAAKVEGFRLKKELARELRAGAPGGRQLKPLRIITRGTRKRNPGASFAKAVRYRAVKSAADLNISVGFMVWREDGVRLNSDGSIYQRLSQKSSGRNWVKKARMAQEGFEFSADAPSPVGPSYRRLFRWIGGGMSKRSALRKYFFMRKRTRRLIVPARPMIDPFWDAHRAEAGRNIVNNFERKMQGERI